MLHQNVYGSGYRQRALVVKLFRAAVLAVYVGAPALAVAQPYSQFPGYTPMGNHGDGTYQPIPDGSSNNPVHVTGGGGGSSGSIGAPGTAGSSAQSVTTTNAGANGTDSSNAEPSALTVLATFTVTQPGAYFVQNQSAATIQVIFDNGSGAAISTELLAPGAGAGQQGGDTSPPMPWFTGRIQVAGATGAQFMARHN